MYSNSQQPIWALGNGHAPCWKERGLGYQQLLEQSDMLVPLQSKVCGDTRLRRQGLRPLGRELTTYRAGYGDQSCAIGPS